MSKCFDPKTQVIISIDIGTQIIMSKCFYHKRTFLNTHRRFRPAIEISRIFPIVCGGLELKQSNLKKQTCWDSRPMFLIFSISEKSNSWTLGMKKQGLPREKSNRTPLFYLSLLRPWNIWKTMCNTSGLRAHWHKCDTIVLTITSVI